MLVHSKFGVFRLFGFSTDFALRTEFSSGSHSYGYDFSGTPPGQNPVQSAISPLRRTG